MITKKNWTLCGRIRGAKMGLLFKIFSPTWPIIILCGIYLCFKKSSSFTNYITLVRLFTLQTQTQEITQTYFLCRFFSRVQIIDLLDIDVKFYKQFYLYFFLISEMFHFLPLFFLYTLSKDKFIISRLRTHYHQSYNFTFWLPCCCWSQKVTWLLLDITSECFSSATSSLFFI